MERFKIVEDCIIDIRKRFVRDLRWLATMIESQPEMHLSEALKLLLETYTDYLSLNNQVATALKEHYGRMNSDTKKEHRH